MIWKHHYSLLVAAGMTVVLLITRPDFEGWHLLPSFGLWGSGHVIIIKLGRRQMSPERAALKDRLEMEKMKVEYEKKIRYSWGDRHAGALATLLVGGIFAVAGGVFWLGTYGPEGVREWLELFGCQC